MKTSISLDEDLQRRAKSYCAEMGWTLSQFIGVLVEGALTETSHSWRGNNGSTGHQPAKAAPAPAGGVEVEAPLKPVKPPHISRTPFDTCPKCKTKDSYARVRHVKEGH